MNKIDLEDAIRIVKDYLDLMWALHEHYEASINVEELHQYRLGIQTFLLAAQEEIEKLKLNEESE